MHKIVLQIIILGLTIGSLVSCGKSNTGCNENTICYSEKPSELIIDMNISQPSGLEEEVLIIIYEGFMDEDDREELLSFYTKESQELIAVPVDRQYSATAKYVFKDKTIIAVEGERIRARSFTNCDMTCWDWDDIPFDLRLHN